MKIFIILALLIPISHANNPTDIYLNHRVLVEPDIYHLFWNYSSSDVTFEVHVKHNGWVAFGISPTGGMANSDVIAAWLKPDGSYNFTDRHITEDLKVLVDKEQNWTPLYAARINEYIVLKFSRKLKLCDSSNEDLDIDVGTPHIIYAWGSNFVAGDISYHGENRSSRVIPLISSLNEKTQLNMNEIETFEFRVNV